jgi:hypothetical protein
MNGDLVEFHLSAATKRRLGRLNASCLQPNAMAEVAGSGFLKGQERDLHFCTLDNYKDYHVKISP